MASTSAPAEEHPDQQAEDRPLQGDDHRLPPGAFEDRQRGCVAGAEHGYQDAEREQGVDEHHAAMM